MTPVSGPSWIRHLGLSLDETHLGEMGGTGPVPPSGRVEPEPDLPERLAPGRLATSLQRYFRRWGRDEEAARSALDQTFVLTGADLYRLDCQSCHGPDGAGRPPEINSLLDPVRGMSPSLLMERMKAQGHPIDIAFARELAADAVKPLKDRLTGGGEKMPPFRHLEGAEVDALLGYLEVLAGVPEAGGQEREVRESAARVGEHLVKGTCHICHDSTGPGSGHMMMMRGVIPSLASFPEQKSVDDVVGKVRRGRSGMMGMMMAASRMPVFRYLTEEEIVAAYVYLVTYPPES